MKNHGPCVYLDTSAKGRGKRHNIWRADATAAGVRYRRRSRDRSELFKWLRGLVLR